MNGLEFYEDTHQYFYEGSEFTSVTTLIKSYSRPFVEDDHAPRVAAREGVTPEEIKRRWAVKRDRAATLGSEVHEWIEHRILELRETNKLTVASPLRGHLRAAGRFLLDHFELAGGRLDPELRVCHPEFGIAGTVDLVAGCFDGVPSLIDWKTNASIEVDGYGNMYWPLNHLDDSNYWHYAMQLSTYARIMRDCYAFDPQQLLVVHLSERGTYDVFPILERDTDVDKILKKGKRP